MGVKNFVRRIGEKTGDKVAQLSKLSPAQIVDVQAKREEYLLEMPNPDDEVARALTEKMMAASSIEVFNAYLPQIVIRQIKRCRFHQIKTGLSEHLTMG